MSSIIKQQSYGIATETQDGLVSTGDQTFSGVKTFSDTVTANNNILTPNRPAVICGAASGSRTSGANKIWGRASGEVFRNVGNGWSTNGTFTAPLPGHYYVRISIRTSSNSGTGYDYLEISPSSSVYGRPIRLYSVSNDTGTYRPYSLEAVVYLEQNDFIIPQLYLSGTATIDGGSTSQTDSQLHIIYIG